MVRSRCEFVRFFYQLWDFGQVTQLFIMIYRLGIKLGYCEDLEKMNIKEIVKIIKESRLLRREGGRK